MRDAPSLVIVPHLIEQGARVVAYDPVGMREASKLIDGVDFAERLCRHGRADCVAILTEWNEFRALDLDRVREMLTRPLMVDLRNIYKPMEMAEAGFAYHSIGRPTVGNSTETARAPEAALQGD